MAGALYKGITIQFGADTKNISQAMREIDGEARELKANLNTVNKSLKFNSDDPSLLAKKFVILNEQIVNTRGRLSQLLEYEKIARAQFEAGDISKSQYTSLTREISKCKTELKSLSVEAKGSFENLKTSILGAKDKLSEFTKAAIAAGAALAVNKLKDIGSAAIETASDLREVQNVVDTSFGDLAYMMEDLADKAIETYGISKLTAKETGSTFMAMAKGMEIAPKTAADMSIALTELSADMASFYNVEQQVASTALNSVFTGETETLKKFGVVMTEANLNAFALEQGIEKTVKQMSQAEKVQLRYNYVMNQTSLAQGDFAKTSGEWANRSRVLQEEITELSTMVGEELINNLGDVQSKADSLFDLVRDAKESGQLSEIIGDVTSALNSLIDIFVRAVQFIYKYRSEIATTVEVMIAFKAAMKISSIISSVISSISALKGALSALTTSTQTQKVAQDALNASMSINPIVALITATTMLASVIGTKLVQSEIDANKEFLKMGESEKAMKELADAADEFADSMESAAQSRADNLSAIEGEYHGYKQLADQLYELVDKQEKTKEDYKQISQIIGSLNDNIDGLGLSFDSTTGKLNMQKSELSGLIDDYETYYKTLAMQESLTQLYKDQYDAEQKLIEAKKEDQKALERFTAAEENYKTVLELSQNGKDTNYDKELKAAKEAFEDASLARNQTKTAVNELSETYSGLNKEIGNINSTLAENAEITEDIGKKTKESGKKVEKTTEELEESYKNASKAVDDYSSEISSLISIQKDISQGNEMSTLEMLDLIDKYPELVSKIKSAENGYTLEKDAIEELIKVRARNMRLAAQEAADSKRQALQEQGMAEARIAAIESAFDSGTINDIAKVNAGEYTDSVQQYLTSYAKSKGIGDIMTDVLSEGIKEGGKAEGLSSADSYFKQLDHQLKMGLISEEEYYNELEKLNNKYYKDSSENLDKYWSNQEKIYAYRNKDVKQDTTQQTSVESAEKYFKALEHEYNMGRKTEEEYYKELERLNNKYYKNSTDNLDKYWSNEEKIYAYRNKALEDTAKNEQRSNEDTAKSLESLKSKIYDLIDARNELNGISSNKNVKDYTEATGFKYTVDETALKKAYQDYSKAQDSLLLEKLGFGNNDKETVKALKGMVSSLEKAGINMLPDLRQAYKELSQARSSISNKTVNVNFGDVYTDGSAEDIEKNFEKVLLAVLERSDKE